MANILRGEIRWADLNAVRGQDQAGIVPVLIVSHDVFNARSGTVIAMALTSQSPAAGFPLTLEIKSVELPKPTWIKMGQIRTLPVYRVGKLIGMISAEEIVQAIEGMNEILGR